MATLDHIGLNRYIYMSASSETMTLGSLANNIVDGDPIGESILNPNSASILGANLDNSRLLLGVNLYNNGPYGYSSWQQMRMSENPLSRHLRKNNQFPIVANGKERIIFMNGKRDVVKERYGTQLVLDEPAVVSSYKPIKLVGTIDDYNNLGAFTSNKFRKHISLDNNIAYFTSDRINQIAGISDKSDEIYDTLKSYYLEDGINSGDSPMSSFEKLVYSQRIYPPQQYTYKSYVRARTTFSFNWNSNINNRQQNDVSDNFATTPQTSSFWPLDVDPNWVNFPTPLVNNLGIKFTSRHPSATSKYDRDTIRFTTSSFGVLFNYYAQASVDLEAYADKGKYSSGLVTTDLLGANSKLKPAPYYSRRHTVLTKESVTSPTGKTQLRNDDLDEDTIFGGEAYWDVPSQSNKYPFDNSYSISMKDTRGKAKEYTVIPEFRMSEHIESLLSSSVFSPPDTLLSLTGGKSDCNNSSTQEFYKIYSNSDFLKNFDIVLEDHKDFTDPSKVTLKCKGFKKLIPYNGFYPVQRTVDLAEQFYASYKDFIQVSTGGSFGGSSDVLHSFQNILTPLFAPGVLFNSIKSDLHLLFILLSSLTKLIKSSFLATKSVSQFTSIIDVLF